MKLKNIFFITIILIIFTGCTAIENVKYSTKSTYKRVTHATDETLNKVSDNIDDIKSNYYENSFVKFFSDDETIFKNREENFIKWSKSSRYNADSILKAHLRKNKSKINPKNLTTENKIQILKDYFFKLAEKNHIKKFEKKYKKPKFDKFLTDAENLAVIHNYKLALADSKHEWKINLDKTIKNILGQVFSTLYNSPKVEFISYDPDDEEIFLAIKSTTEDFKEKIKLDLEKKLARNINTHISKVKPTVYFKLYDDKLAFVGINILYNKQMYIADIVENSYVRESNIVFVNDEINLKNLDIKYSNVIKDIKPPKWHRNIPVKKGTIIGYGEGISKDEAKAEARVEIRESIEVSIGSTFSKSSKEEGSIYSNNSNSNIQIKASEKSLKGSIVIKDEKKDGLWFVAVKYTKNN